MLLTCCLAVDMLKTSYQIYDRVLNKSLDYLSCFAIVPRGIHENIWYTPNWLYSIHCNNLIWCFWSFFNFLHFNLQDNNCHKWKCHMLFFTLIKLLVSVLVSAHAIAHIKWSQKTDVFYNELKKFLTQLNILLHHTCVTPQIDPQNKSNWIMRISQCYYSKT